jgi:hypothetical protein
VDIITRKRGDLLPPIVVAVRYPDGVEEEITEALSSATPASVTIRPRHNGSPLVDRAPGVVSVLPPSGNLPGGVRVTLPLSPAITATVGEYHVEVEFLVDGSPWTAPTEGWLRLRVVEDLD